MQRLVKRKASVHARVVTASCYNCYAHPFRVHSTLYLFIFYGCLPYAATRQTDVITEKRRLLKRFRKTLQNKTDSSFFGFILFKCGIAFQMMWYCHHHGIVLREELFVSGGTCNILFSNWSSTDDPRVLETIWSIKMTTMAHTQHSDGMYVTPRSINQVCEVMYESLS